MLKSNVMALPVLLVSLRVIVYWMLTGPVSSPFMVTLKAAVAVSSSRISPVAVAVPMVTPGCEELLMVPSTVSVASSRPSSSTVTVMVPVVAPLATLMLPPLMAV